MGAVSTQEMLRTFNCGIGMVVLAIALLAGDRYLGRPAPGPALEEVAAPQAVPADEPMRDAAWAAQQMKKLRRTLSWAQSKISVSSRQ